jgi:hypothetical protein
MLEIDEFAADHEVKQLLRGTIWHGETFLNEVPGERSDGSGSGAVVQGKG